MADQLTPEQIAEFKDTFLSFDKDGDESIGATELRTVLRSLGLDPTEEEVQEMVDEVDEDGSGCIEFDEFLIMIANKMKETTVADETKEAFRVFDRFGSGHIKALDFKEDMLAFGEVLTEEEVDTMIHQAGINEDGQINYEQFINTMMGINSGTELPKPKPEVPQATPTFSELRESTQADPKPTEIIQSHPKAADNSQNNTMEPWTIHNHRDRSDIAVNHPRPCLHSRETPLSFIVYL